MSSWFSEKVGNLVRDVQRQASSVGTGSAPRNADELAAELELQARRVNGPQSATELLAKWVERSDGNQSLFPLGAAGGGSHGLAEPLSFYQALLRSQAFEALLEACGRVPSLRAELLWRGADAEAAPLSRALRSVAERLLLPGALALWPSLLEVLVAAGASEEGTPLLESKCRPWARRALALVKRQWQSEILPASLRCLDRKLTALMAKQPLEEDGGAKSDLLQGGCRGGMSKSGIRAAMARDNLRRRVAEAAMLRAKTELLCDACARLEAAESSGATAVPEVEKLLSDADDMLAALDTGVKAQLEEQETLRRSLREVTSALEDQISQFQETLASFNEKRGPLLDEKAALMRRLEEVNMQILQIDEDTAGYEKKARGLAGQLRDTTNHYEDKIARSFGHQKRLADEKLRAVACKECAHTVLDVVRGDEQRRSAELAAQLRKRRAELRRACSAYVREERLRLEVAAECAQSERTRRLAPGSKAEASGAEAALEAWQSAQAVLRRAVPLLLAADGAAARPPPRAAGSEGAASEPAAAQEAGRELESARQIAPEDGNAFFARVAAQGRSCADCGDSEADWASLSYGTYLCVDCAGRHRGLGVHLSFVRSTTMDIWSSDQLRRMQVGGTPRFVSFLQSYPQLQEPPRTVAALSTRYGSRAAAYYRRLLDARCEGSDATDMEQPPPGEGHLPAEDNADSSGTMPGGASPQSSGDAVEGDDGEQATHSLEEEQDALQAAYEAHREHLNLPEADLSWKSSVREGVQAPRAIASASSRDIPAAASIELRIGGEYPGNNPQGMQPAAPGSRSLVQSSGPVPSFPCMDGASPSASTEPGTGPPPAPAEQTTCSTEHASKNDGRLADELLLDSTASSGVDSSSSGFEGGAEGTLMADDKCHRESPAGHGKCMAEDPVYDGVEDVFS